MLLHTPQSCPCLLLWDAGAAGFQRGGMSLKGASHHIIWLLLGLLQGVPMPQTSCTALHPPRQKSPALSSPGTAELAEGRISACQLISSKARLQKENMPKMSYVTHLHKYVLKIRYVNHLGHSKTKRTVLYLRRNCK